MDLSYHRLAFVLVSKVAPELTTSAVLHHPSRLKKLEPMQELVPPLSLAPASHLDHHLVRQS